MRRTKSSSHGTRANPHGNGAWRTSLPFISGKKKCHEPDAWVGGGLAGVLPPEPPPEPPRQAHTNRKGSAAGVASKVVSKVVAAAVGAIACKGGCSAVGASPDSEDDIEEQVREFKLSGSRTVGTSSASCDSKVRRGGAARRAADRIRSRCRRATGAMTRHRSASSCNKDPAPLYVQADIERIMEDLERSRMALEDRDSRAAAEAELRHSTVKPFHQHQSVLWTTPSPGWPSSFGSLVETQEGVELPKSPASPAVSCSSTPTFAAELSPRPELSLAPHFAHWPQAVPDTPEAIDLPWSVLATRNERQQEETQHWLPGALQSPASSAAPARMGAAQRLFPEMLHGDASGESLREHGRTKGRNRPLSAPSLCEASQSTPPRRRRKRSTAPPAWTADSRSRSCNPWPECEPMPPVRLNAKFSPSEAQQRLQPVLSRSRQPSITSPALEATLVLSPPLQPLNGSMPFFPPADLGSPEQRPGNAAAAAHARSRSRSEQSSPARSAPRRGQTKDKDEYTMEFFTSSPSLAIASSSSTQDVEKPAELASIDVDHLISCLMSSHGVETPSDVKALEWHSSDEQLSMETTDLSMDSSPQASCITRKETDTSMDLSEVAVTTPSSGRSSSRGGKDDDTPLKTLRRLRRLNEEQAAMAGSRSLVC